MKHLFSFFALMSASAIAQAQQVRDVHLTPQEYVALMNELASHDAGMVLLMKKQAEAQKAAAEKADAAAEAPK